MFREMYATLFNAITDCLAELKEHNYGRAEQILVNAQREAENCYMEGGDAT